MGTTRTWIGGTTNPVNQVSTVTVGSNTNGQTFTILFAHPSGVSGETVTIASHTASGDTTSTIAANLAADITASSHAFAKAVTAEASSATVIITANVSGVPFVATVGGTGTISIAATTANAGRNDWTTPGNWAEGIVPVANDDVVIQGNVDILYGLNQTGITLDTLQVVNYTGKVGMRHLPLIIEPEEDVLVDCMGEFHMRLATTVGLARMIITAATNVSISGDAATGAGTITSLFVNHGSVVLGADRVTGFTVSNLYVQHASVQVNQGMSVTNIFQTAGEVHIDSTSGLTLVRVDSGSFYGYKFHATTVTQNGGYVQWDDASDVIGTYNLNRGLLETRFSRKARTITTLNQDQQSEAYFDTASVAVTTHTRTGPFLYKGAGDAKA